MKFIILTLLLTACVNKADSPEAALKDFIDSRIEKIVSRDFIVERTTGKLLSSLEAMSEEEFNRFADLRSIKRDSFKILSKNCQEKRCYVTYSLGYKLAPEGKTTWRSEIKKIAEIQWIEGKWLIADVSNLKTYHESVETIEVSP